MSTQLHKGLSLDKVKRRVGVTDQQLGRDIRNGFAKVTSAGGRFNYMTQTQADQYAARAAERAARSEAERSARGVESTRDRDLAEAEELRRQSELLRAKHGS